MYVAEALQLRDGDRARLEALMRASTAPAGLVARGRIVLMAADGVSNTEIAQRMGTSRPTVLKWRDRYSEAGIEGLTDLPRPGRRREIDEIEVLAETLADKGKPPAELGVRPCHDNRVSHGWTKIGSLSTQEGSLCDSGHIAYVG